MRGILITGGNGGLGLAIGRYFLERDVEAIVRLGIHSRREAADALAAEFPERCETLELDVTSAADWANAAGVFPDVAVLVNNAGVHKDALLTTMKDETWSSVISTNLDSVFLGCRAVIPAMMRERHGRIINISSLSAILPPLGQTNYAAAKAGVVALTRTLAKETARAGITVNSILPGYIETGALDDMDEETRKAARARVPMRRFGKPAEVAAAVYFLASEEAAYITGAALKIDGGIY
ncbi:MAG: SDR family NAD(P)-dependent oxidoreductase [Verrucomicrobiota bacterium]